MDIIHIAHAAETATTASQAGPVQLFGLNWKLFLAQLINFSIVLFVLWKWVFRPVSKGLADRTSKIEASLAEAEKIAADRETFDSWKDKEIAQVRQEASQIITEAKAHAEQARSEITKTAMEESARVLERGKQQLEDEKNKTIQEIKSEVAGMVVTATESILKKKIDSNTDKELINEAVAKLK